MILYILYYRYVYNNKKNIYIIMWSYMLFVNAPMNHLLHLPQTLNLRPGTLEININAQLKASHSRRLLEVELIGRSSGSVSQDGFGKDDGFGVGNCWVFP